MPEVIEVKTYSDFINNKLKNKYIKEVNIINGRYKNRGPFELYSKLKKTLPLKIKNVNSKGKFIYFTFENNLFMFNTLGLSGGWIFKENNKFYHPLLKKYIDKDKTDSYMNNALNHLNVEFKLNDGTLYFYDTLSFGTIKIVDNITELNKKLNSLGNDIMDINTTFDMFREKIMKKTNYEKEIGNVLMDQKLISGIGNYLRADTLWLSRISPFRKIKNVSTSELKTIYTNARFLIWSEYDYNKGIKLGVVDKNAKLPNDYKRTFFVYDNDEDIFGNHISKDELYSGSQKRFIYWVPKLQK